MGILSSFAGSNDIVATIYVRAVDEASAKVQAIGKELEATGAKAEASSKSFISAGSAMTGLGLGLAGVTVYAVDAAAKFESSMELLRTQAGASQAEVDHLKDAVLGLAPAVGMGPDVLAGGLYHLESAGFRGAESLRLLKAAAEGAAIGHANLEDVTQALVAVTASHISGVKNEIDAMAQLNAIVGSGDMRMEQLATALSSGVVPAAATVGLSLRDVGAGLATLTDNAIPADEAATRMRMTFSLMEAPSAKASKALESIGMTSRQMAEDMRQPNGLLVAVQDLHDHLDKLSKVDAAQTIAAIFGGGRTSSVMETWLGQLDRLKQKYEDQKKAAGDFGAAWEKTQQTFTFQIEKMKAGAEALAVSIGERVLPKAAAMLAWADDVASHMPKSAAAVRDFADAWDHLGQSEDKHSVKAASTANILDVVVASAVHGQTLALKGLTDRLSGVTEAAGIGEAAWQALADQISVNNRVVYQWQVGANGQLELVRKIIPANQLAAESWDKHATAINVARLAALHFGSTFGQVDTEIASTVDWVNTLTDRLKHAKAATDDWASSLDTKLNKALEAVAKEQTLGQPVSQKQLDTIKALAAESISYSDKLAALRAEYGLDTTATQRLNASLDATATAADSAGTKAETLKEKLARLRAELLGVADAANIAWQAITGGQWAGSPGLGGLGSGLGSVMSGGFPGGPAGGLGLGLGSLVPSVPSPTGTFTGPYGPFAGPGLLGAAGQGSNTAALPFGVSIAMPSFTPGVSGAGGDAGPSAGGFGVDLSGFGQVRDILGQIAAEQQKVDSGSLKLTADNSQIAAQSLQAQAQGIADLTSVMAAQSNVLSVDAQGTIQGINDQSAIARASYALSQANTPQARAAAQQQLVIAQQEADYHRQEAAVNHKIAEAGVKAAEDKAKWDKTIAADQAKADAAQLQVDSDSQQIQLDTLKVLTDGFTSLTGASVGTGLLSSPAEQRLAGDQNALSAAQGTLSSDQGLAAVNAAQDAQGIEVLREALARIMEQAGISGANGQLTMEQLSEAMQQNTAATTSNTQTTQQVKDQQDEMLRLYNEMKSLYSRGGTIRGGGNSVATSFSVFWDTRGAQANYTAAGRP